MALTKDEVIIVQRDGITYHSTIEEILKLNDGISNVPSGDVPPANPEAGNLWFNSDDGRLYVYYVDDNSSQWVDASPDSWNPDVIPGVGADPHQPNTLDDRYVEKTGDKMTGNLELPGCGEASDALQKQEIEALISTSEGTAGDTYLSKLSNDTAAGAISFESTTTHEQGIYVTGAPSDRTKSRVNGGG